MRIFGKVIGYILFFGSGAYLWWVGTVFLYYWLGIPGLFLGFIFPPIDFFIPFIMWAVTKTFPLIYFIVFLIGIVGMIIASVSRGSKDY
ncbi:MAG: hypothetical protein M1479_03915 [Actinobacteria bacterium]|nr:hypothetical protein [Cyanobacteriota bacterium]MCL5771404.1 hypothetical protein [Actinomycetota bacterium]